MDNNQEEVYAVSFTIRLKREPGLLIMMPEEMKRCIKHWLQNQFEDYFMKFKIINLKCTKVKIDI